MHNVSLGYHFLKHKYDNSELLWTLCMKILLIAWKIYFYRLVLDIEFSGSFSRLIFYFICFYVCHELLFARVRHCFSKISSAT